MMNLLETGVIKNSLKNRVRIEIRIDKTIMIPRHVICIHDAEHDATNDDGIFHSGLFSLLSRSDLESVVLVAAGADPRKSNLAAKTQAIQYSDVYSKKHVHPLVSDIEYLMHLPPGWSPRIHFAEINSTHGQGCVADLPISLNNAILAANTIPNMKTSTIIDLINNGAIICGHAPGYATFIKEVYALGANFNHSTLIVQGASSDDQIASTYNDKDGWINIKERTEFFNKFKEVNIHDRITANNHLLLGGDELKMLGEVFYKDNYRDSADDYVKETICGPRSISFIKTGALVASRQPFAINNAFWGENGPYSPMMKDLMQTLSDITNNCIYMSRIEFREWILNKFNTTSNKSVVSEKVQDATIEGIDELFDSIMPECLNDGSISPLAMRIIFMIHLTNDLINIETISDEKIADFLWEHCTRTVFDPISLFFVHKILETKESNTFDIVKEINSNGHNILSNLNCNDNTVIQTLINLLNI